MKNFAKVENWMPDEEKNFRYGIDGLMNSINHYKLLPKTIDKYTVFDSGLSSVVVLVQDQNNSPPYILKTALTPQKIINEATALDYWGKVVKTPTIYNLHQPDNQLPVAFFTAELITKSDNDTSPASRLKDTPIEHRIESGLSKKIGWGLALIHQLPLPDDSFSFSTTNTSDICHSTKRLKRKLLDGGVVNGDILPLINESIATIEAQSNSQNRLCHNDFLPYNLLIQDNGTMVVFDPDAEITHPLSDLANTLLVTLVEANEAEAIEILNGYRSVTEVDLDVLRAFFIHHCVRKIDKWQKKDRSKKVAATQALLNDIPAFLRKSK